MSQPIVEEIKPVLPPDAIFTKVLKNVRYPFFLDSGSNYGRLGRFSFIGYDPFLVFKSKKNNVQLEWDNGEVETFNSNPFTALNNIFKKYSFLNKNRFLPFMSGGVGYFSYDLKSFIEDLPDSSLDDMNLPDCIFGFYDRVVICDNLKRKTYIASSGLPETNFAKNRQRAEIRLKEFKDNLSRSERKEKGFLSSQKLIEKDDAPPSVLRSNFSKASYIEAIKKAKFYIRRGDIYQVNLSQRFETELNMEPQDLYFRLRDFSPAPFSSYIDFKDVIILSSSPERFLLKRGRYIETRPIKGTRPRGENRMRDSLLEKELLHSSKDRAEHIMIVDLERNDLGRICEYGSVRPTETIVLERYSNVFHLVSTVAGHLKREIDPVDCLLATFPGGSITGAPKIRSMEIIEELEPVKRSIYTGAIGYISFDGNMDTSIVIRTFLIKKEKVYFSVGGGIVADSIPEDEYEETLQKAEGLMLALGGGMPTGSAVRRELVSI